MVSLVLLSIDPTLNLKLQTGTKKSGGDGVCIGRSFLAIIAL